MTTKIIVIESGCMPSEQIEKVNAKEDILLLQVNDIDKVKVLSLCDEYAVPVNDMLMAAMTAIQTDSQAKALFASELYKRMKDAEAKKIK